MYQINREKSLLSVIFKQDNYIKSDIELNHIIYEDSELIITPNKIKNLFSAHGKDIFKYKENSYRFKIALKAPKSFHAFNKTAETSAYQMCHSFHELIRPIFLKNIFVDGTVLKQHQIEGIEWLEENKIRLLADDMGLGKTLQTIAKSASLIQEGKIKSVLVICPTTLVYNWCHEIKKWVPDFCVTQISNTGPGEKKHSTWDILYESAHFIITSYDHLRVLPKVLINESPELVIADEIHKLRKKSSKIHKSIKSMSPARFWGLSGTPIEKDTNDLINILSLMDKKLNQLTLKTYSNNHLSVFADSYMLRRMKSDVLHDLKGFEESEHYLELNPDQLETYNRYEANFCNSKQGDQLKTFGQLKQICDFDLKNNSSSKLDYIEEMLEKIKLKNEKCVVFSFWLLPLNELKKRLNNSYKENFSIMFDGSMDKVERVEALHNFKNNSDSTVLLCSGKIGGEGINLTEANHVIFINDWWNPSNNNQARDRVVRIGQLKTAFITHLRSVDTIDERVGDILREKKSITKEVIESIVVKLREEKKNAK